MSNKDDGGPAFGQVVDLHCVRVEMTGNTEWEPAVLADSGMRLRDYFAAKAMQAMIGTSHESEMRGYAGWREEFARESYRYADSMLEARKK